MEEVNEFRELLSDNSINVQPIEESIILAFAGITLGAKALGALGQTLIDAKNNRAAYIYMTSMIKSLGYEKAKKYFFQDKRRWEPYWDKLESKGFVVDGKLTPKGVKAAKDEYTEIKK